MNKILKGDNVMVIAGKDKGKRGTVLSRVVEGLMTHQGPIPFLRKLPRNGHSPMRPAYDTSRPSHTRIQPPPR